MSRYANRARAHYTSTGTGSLTLGSAVAGCQSFAAAGVQDGEEVDYVIVEGTDWEVGWGVYSTSGPTLTRHLKESSTGSLLSVLGGGDVAVAPDAATFRAFDIDNWFFR